MYKFNQRWHRDDVKENATEAEELEALQVWHHGVCSLAINSVHQLIPSKSTLTGPVEHVSPMYHRCPFAHHLRLRTPRALYTDACLFVVPKSHKLPRTPEQRLRSSISDPPTDPFDMPGATQVILQRKYYGSTSRLDVKA